MKLFIFLAFLGVLHSSGQELEDLKILFDYKKPEQQNLFVREATIMVDSTLKSGVRNKDLEMFFFNSLSDSRKEEILGEDHVIPPPNAVCADLLAKLTGYYERNHDQSFPIFAIDQEAIWVFKVWYEKTYLANTSLENERAVKQLVTEEYMGETPLSEKKTLNKEKVSEEVESIEEKPTLFPWWIIGLVVLLAILFFLLKGKSKR